MKHTSSITLAVSMAFVYACADAPHSESGQVDNTLVPEPLSGSGSGSPTPPACPLGTATFITSLGASNPSQLLSIATEPDGRVLVAGSNPTTAAGVSGVTELSPSGAVLATFPFGSLVATDAAGNKYIAGSLTAPIDVGNGLVLTPMGHMNVFVVKLDSAGHVVFARVLDVCGDSLVDLSVGADGRIALSGTAFGTAVLSASGDLEEQFPEIGQVAFDSTGDLLIAGSQTATEFAFLERRDPAGTLVFRTSFEGQGTQLTGLVLDTHDNIVFSGFTTDFVDIFGLDITAQFSPESGRVTGAFVAKVTPSFTRLLVLDLGIVEANAVAVDSDARIFVGGAVTVNTGFFRAPVIITVDASGMTTTFDFGGEGGRVLALAVDACGSVLAGLVRQQSPTPGSPIDAVVQKLEL
jgi:hypothetical protein